MSKTNMNCGRCKTEVDEDKMCGHCGICEIDVCRSCAHTWHGEILCETCHEENDTCSCDDCLCDECGEANTKVCGCNVYTCRGCEEDLKYDEGDLCGDCERCCHCGCECEVTRRICYLCNKECSCWNYNIEHKVICTDCECWPHEEETPKDQTVS